MLNNENRSHDRDRDSIGAFLFDVDGVLADTARLHERAWRAIARREGLPFDDAIARELRGRSREESLRRILGNRRVPLARFNAIMEAKNAEYVRLVDGLTAEDTLPGARELLVELNERGIRTAAVSASKNARRVLERLGLSGVSGRYPPFLETIVDGNDEAVERLHRYLSAAAALRVDPGRCVVVEDSQAGIAAARQFGMRSIGLGTNGQLVGATLVFESLRGVEARHLLHWLRGAPDKSDQPETVLTF